MSFPSNNMADQPEPAAAVDSRPKLRILVVSPLYGGSLPIAGYAARALRKLGHRVEEMDMSSFHHGFRRIEQTVTTPNLRTQLQNIYITFLSELILARAVEAQVDLVFALAQAPLLSSASTRLRERGILTAFWFVENYRHMEYWRTLASEFDYFFTIQKGEFFRLLSEAGAKNFCYLPTACDPEDHHPLDREPGKEYVCDVSFAGAAYHNRLAMFEGLADYNLKLWGIEWYRNPALKRFVQKDGVEYTTDEMLEIVAGSKISLNLHSSAQYDGVDPEGDFLNPRTFEVASCGGFQLVDERQGLEELFEIGKEVVTFRDLKSLRDALDYYLAHPDERKSIAENGCRRALRDHTYERRMEDMLAFIFERDETGLARRSIERVVTVAEARDAARAWPELVEYLDKLPPDSEFRLDQLVKAIKEAEATKGLEESEAILLMLDEVARARK